MIREEEISPEGRKGDETAEVRRARTTGGTFHLTSQVVKVNLSEGVEEQKPKNIEKEISPEGWMQSKNFQNKVRRLERARHQRDRLVRDLEEVWSFLEKEMPGLETWNSIPWKNEEQHLERGREKNPEKMKLEDWRMS